MIASSNTISENISIHSFADFILDVGVFLMSSGAHCGRVASNLERLSERWGYNIHINPTYTGLTVTLQDKNNAENTVTQYKSSPTYNIHLRMLTEISRLSWMAKEENLSFEAIKSTYLEIKRIPNYNTWIISLAVAFSCACLCMLAGGDYINGLIALVASFVGSTVRFGILRMQFNLMISYIIAAFVTTLIAGLGMIYHIGTSPEATLATSVLYLIPGVPLINSVIDLIEGYLPSSLARGLFSAFILLCIAAGMTLSITLLGIENF